MIDAASGPISRSKWSGCVDSFRSSMRNLLDKSSIAQSLDGDRLMGSLHFPATVSRSSAAHPQQEPNGSKYPEAVRAVSFRSARRTKTSVAPYRMFLCHALEIFMNLLARAGRIRPVQRVPGLQIGSRAFQSACSRETPISFSRRSSSKLRSCRPCRRLSQISMTWSHLRSTCKPVPAPALARGGS
jgi:hypothetical protein